jgi:hypothetical protein
MDFFDTIKSVNVRYDKDDGLYYIGLIFENDLKRSICVDDNFFDDTSYISAHEILKIEHPDLTEKEIDKIVKKVLAY